jgi:hypothetical protein
MVTKERNCTIALEFFTNAFGSQSHVAYVRGKQVDYSPRAINAFLGLKPPRQCHVEFRRQRSTNNFPSDDVLRQIL